MAKELRAGVIGVGAMGKNHARLYSQLPGVELVGVADSNEALAASIARQYECQHYTDYSDLLAQRLDLVSIVVPTTLHKQAALAAISSGVNVLVEKPISDAVENADEMIEAARRKGVKLMVGHVERFNPAVIKLKELVDEGLLGEVVSISTRRVGPHNPRIRDVGIILDLGAHDIDVMHYLYGERSRGLRLGRHRRPQPRGPRHHHAQLPRGWQRGDRYQLADAAQGQEPDGGGLKGHRRGQLHRADPADIRRGSG
jgi:UDP-N-acetylglucosamine 3-dehydrogenase